MAGVSIVTRPGPFGGTQTTTCGSNDVSGAISPAHSPRFERMATGRAVSRSGEEMLSVRYRCSGPVCPGSGKTEIVAGRCGRV